MAQQTAVEWLIDWMGKNQYFIGNDLIKAVEQAKAMEEKQLKDGMMYALDEDGHTGDWKIRFVDTYYEQMYKK